MSSPTRKRYRDLLKRESALAALSGAFLAGLSISVAALGLVLLVNEVTDSFAAAGAALAAFGCANGLLAPLMGRAVDRLGHRLLPALALLYALLLLGILGLAGLDAATPFYVVAAALVGAVVPPVGAALRATWKEIVSSSDELPAAYALQNVAQEAYLTSGPLIVGGLVLVGSAKLALGAAAALGLLGTLIFSGSRASRASRALQATTKSPAKSVVGPLRSAGMKTLAISIFGVGMAFGAIEIGVTGFAVAFGSSAGVGPLLTLTALGSVLGGLWHGERIWQSSLASRYAVMVAAFAVIVFSLALASSPGVLGVGLFVAGLFVAPAWTCVYGLLDSVAPRGTATEAYAWLSMANNVGVAAGAALAGILVGASGPELALAFGGICAAIGALVATGRQTSLTANTNPYKQQEPVAAISPPSA